MGSIWLVWHVTKHIGQNVSSIFFISLNVPEQWSIKYSRYMFNFKTNAT